ncbi:Mannan-binding lectin serine protease 1 [Zancudomyces culisetae]|uniref:Mannan-binding lectin serine protease 1 n=1 Tax=Zancudomyces culisetae TaxID=1213189 RepID=A0A1R1PTU6_ZANCU|nr:Mannan-binding lectin serine protease 1 [Zancudomyces culisetae]|eukprot:OMH84371.1 Mannan-binding lectin serine protease 1 [Zancudomyces culisetae]
MYFLPYPLRLVYTIGQVVNFANKYSQYSTIAAAHTASVGSVDSNGISPQSEASEFHNDAEALNGEPVKREDFPFIGMLRVYNGGGSIGCSASMISDNIAVAAASCCLYDYDISKLGAFPGLITTYIETPTFNYTFTVAIMKIHIHPEFSPVTLENDIAVIDLGTSASKDPFTPVAIYTGNVTDDMNLATTLHKFTQSPSSSSICKDADANWSDNNKNLVCTLEKDGKDLENGDRGDPLLYINNGVHFLVGIASATGKFWEWCGRFSRKCWNKVLYPCTQLH